MAAQRLPIPGSDNGTWGSILNGFLGVSHNADGTLISSAITTAGGLTQSAADVRYAANGSYESAGTTAALLTSPNTWTGNETFNGTVNMQGPGHIRSPIGSYVFINGSNLATDTSDHNNKIIQQFTGTFEGGFSGENTTDSQNPTYIWGIDAFFVTGGTTGDVAGIQHFIGAEIEAHLHTPGASLTDIQGIQVNAELDSTATNATVGTMYGIYFPTPTALPSGASVGTYYGIKIDAQNQYGSYSVPDAVCVSGTNTITSTTGGFTPAMVGMAVTCANFAAGTVVIAETSNGLTLSTNATASSTVTLSINQTFGIYCSAPLVAGSINTVGGSVFLGSGALYAQSVAVGAPGSSGAIGRLCVYSNAAGAVGQVIRGFSGQTGDLLQFQQSNGTVYARVDSVGNLDIEHVGAGLKVAEGSNAKQGTATLVAGTVTVANTSVTATSRIFLSAQSLGTVATPQALAVTARTAGTSFTITSASASDTSVIAWEIFEVG